MVYLAFTSINLNPCSFCQWNLFLSTYKTRPYTHQAFRFAMLSVCVRKIERSDSWFTQLRARNLLEVIFNLGGLPSFYHSIFIVVCVPFSMKSIFIHKTSSFILVCFLFVFVYENKRFEWIKTGQLVYFTQTQDIRFSQIKKLTWYEEWRLYTIFI